jgi:putative addiction module component (TIGR02574 family)
MQLTDLNLAKLSVEERIQLVEDLWDSIASDAGDIAVTDTQRVELERRLTDLQQDTAAGEPWGDVRGRIEKRIAQAE